MRRADREITGFDEIVELIGRCDTIRLGMADKGAPYVVPLSFGYEVVDGVVFFYIHGATEGRKHRLLDGRPRVCVEGDILHGYVDDGRGRSTSTCDYESFIGWGNVERVIDEAALKGLRLLLEHCRLPADPLGPEVLKVTAVYRIKIDELTGKRNRPGHA